MTQPSARSTRRGRASGEGGAALVEFSIVMVLLLLLVFGIISFGLILSFDQDMTRAAAEGARGGAVALPVGTQTYAEAARLAADDAVAEAVLEFGGTFSGPGCSRAGMTCTPATVAPCAEEPTLDCVTVELTFDYDGNPLYGRMPIISAFLPDTVEATSVARING